MESKIEKYAFTVCRIEPENNIHLILEAFAELPDFPLIIVGNWKNSEYGLNLRDKYQNSKHIQLLDPIYEQDKLNKLRANCSVYLHGHSCGGTNPSLVEAMYLGLAIIAFDVNFNHETTEKSALYFNSSAQLKEKIKNLNYSKLQNIRYQMQEISHRRYVWQRISQNYAKLF